jgi:hypothetical protein
MIFTHTAFGPDKAIAGMSSRAEALPVACEYMAWETQARAPAAVLKGNLSQEPEASKPQLPVVTQESEPDGSNSVAGAVDAAAEKKRLKNKKKKAAQKKKKANDKQASEVAPGGTLAPASSSVAVSVVGQLNEDINELEARLVALEAGSKDPWLQSAAANWWNRYEAPPAPQAVVGRRVRQSGSTIEVVEVSSDAPGMSAGPLLLRSEHNAAAAEDVSTVLVYCHGFPDSAGEYSTALPSQRAHPLTMRALHCAVRPHALSEAESPELPAHALFASAVPRKWCDGLLRRPTLQVRCQGTISVRHVRQGSPLPRPPAATGHGLRLFQYKWRSRLWRLLCIENTHRRCGGSGADLRCPAPALSQRITGKRLSQALRVLHI